MQLCAERGFIAGSGSRLPLNPAPDPGYALTIYVFVTLQTYSSLKFRNEPVIVSQAAQDVKRTERGFRSTR